MKYADSFHHTETMTASDTTYSPWFDISWANELYVYTDSTVSNTSSVVITLERYAPYRTPAPIDVLAVGTITSTTTSEGYAGWMYDGSAPGAENKLGMRVRFKYVMTWTSGTSTVYNTIYAKRN